MTDDRQIPVVEVPLSGDDAPTVGTAGPDRRPPDWRRVVAISGLAGVVLGAVVAVVIRSSSDDGDEDESASATTSVDADDLAPSITVPPTLTPIGSDASDGSSAGGGVAPLPTIADADPDALVAYDLDEALLTLDENAPRRAHTRYVAGAAGFVLDVNVVHDSLNDRYRIEFEIDGDDPDRQRLLLDARGEWSYVTAGDFWLRLPNAQIVEQTGSADVGALARSILLGPVRSDTDPSVVTAAGLVSLDGTPVREFTVAVAAGAVPEWAAYVFAPSAEVPPRPSADLLTFTVHVDGDARLRRVAGASAYGATEQSIVHTISRLPRLEVIDLPTSYAVLGEDGEVITDSAQLVPEYQPVTGEPPADGYDVGTALANLTESPPLRATVELLDARTVTTAARDPESDVVAVMTGGSADASLLVDTSSWRTFLANDDGSYDEDGLVDGEAFVVALLQGVIDPDSMADAEPVAFVQRGGTTVRRYDVAVPTTAVRSLLFAGFGMARDAAVPVRIFVDEGSRVVELQVLSTGGVPEALVQRFEHDGEAPTVTLPLDAG